MEQRHMEFPNAQHIETGMIVRPKLLVFEFP